MEISKILNENLSYIKNNLCSDDVEVQNLKINDTNCALIFIRDIVSKQSIGELIMKPIRNYNGTINFSSIEDIFLSPEKKEITQKKEIIDEVISGNSVFIIDGISKGISFGFKHFEKRNISEPPTSTVIKGPREGFVESLPVNINMIRRRMKSQNLIFEDLNVGKYSDTSVCICYVKGIVNNYVLNSVREKIKKINIDAILDSSYIAKFIVERRGSIFKQIGTTEKPDILVSKIIEGRVAIIVDGSPIVLTVPYLMIEDFQSPSDYYSSAYTASLSRFLRMFAVFVSLYLPSFFVAAELFHLQLIPLSFLLTIVNSIKGIPLSPSYEMFFTLLIFEVLNEASVRMPKYVGMVVSIVGGLVLGETAVSAGIISAPTLMIIAFSGICLYTVPELEKSFSIIRLVLLIVGGSLGAYGILLTSAFICIYLFSFENFSVPILAPFSPFIAKDLKDSAIRVFLTEQKNRPESFHIKNKTRMKKGKR